MQGDGDECPISLLDGIYFKSIRAATAAVSKLVGEKVPYTVEGICYAIRESNYQYTLNGYLERYDEGWTLRAKVSFPDTQPADINQQGFKTRQAALNHINAYIGLMLEQRKRYPSVA